MVRSTEAGIAIGLQGCYTRNCKKKSIHKETNTGLIFHVVILEIQPT